MTDASTRDRLAEAIRTAHRPDCGWCRSGDRTCPEHAAEAVLEAFRGRNLVILSKADVDRLVLAEGRRVRAEACEEGAQAIEAAGRDQSRGRTCMWPHEAAQIVRALAGPENGS